MEKLRQAIHAYPFNYAPVESPEFFAAEAAAIYIHIPFCRQKCHFCDFTVYLNKGDDARAAYVASLCQEIRLFAANRSFPIYRIESIYIGGGTPGLLTVDQLATILATCRDCYDVAEDCEISVEFDPLAITTPKVAEAVQAGFTRISVGVQSFDDRLLAESNRPHDSNDAVRAFADLSAAGMLNSNLDLIYPLPGLSLDVWQDTVAKAIALEPASITMYGLEVWPDTVFHRRLTSGAIAWPSSEAEVEMYFAGTALLEKAGFVGRSINGYAHPERTTNYCRYLDFYWNGRPTIGFGVSARSAVDTRVWTNVKGLRQYAARIESGAAPLEFGRRLSKRDEMKRTVIRGLKACRIFKTDFVTRYGVPIDDVFATELAALVGDGLVSHDDRAVRLTRTGRALANNVFARFCADDDERPLAEGEISIGRSMLVSQ